MARRRNEQELRRAKEVITEAVVVQQRKLGVFNPGGKEVEKFVEPIVAEMERKPLKDVAPEPEIVQPEVMESHLGTYDWDGQNLKAQAGDAYQFTMTDRMHQIVRQMLKHPTWALELQRARDVCMKHQAGHPRQGCKFCSRREVALELVMAKAYQKYGNPLVGKRDPRIVVGAR